MSALTDPLRRRGPGLLSQILHAGLGSLPQGAGSGDDLTEIVAQHEQADAVQNSRDKFRESSHSA